MGAAGWPRQTVSWRRDETNRKVKGAGGHLVRAADELGKPLDFKPSRQRTRTAATKVLARAIKVINLPSMFVIDHSRADTARTTVVYRVPPQCGCPIPIEMV
jgi:putative transposase